MKVELINKCARIPLADIAGQTIEQWRAQKAVDKDQQVEHGVMHENGQWYITFRVIEKHKPSISIVKK
jgi:hypothetical protein